MRRTIYVSLFLLIIIPMTTMAQRQRANATRPSPDQLFNVNPAHTSQNSLERQLTDLSQQISNGLAENQKRTIAVIEFVDLKGNITNFGRFLAEELITRLYQTKKFKVIERQLLNKVIAEQKLSLTGVIEQASAQRLGRLLGVDSIASGTVTDLGKTLRVNARLINAETGEIFAVASTEIVKDESVMNLMGSDVVQPTPDTNPQSSKSSSIKEARRKVTVNDFTVELSFCKMAGQTVNCDFNIVNNSSEDKGFWLSRAAGWQGENSARIFDDLGNEYRASGARLGSKVDNSDHIYLGITLIPQVATKAGLKFENISLQATTIKLLRVAFEAGSIDLAGRGNFLFADFRDVSIIR
jgi:TolB-like protein